MRKVFLYGLLLVAACVSAQVSTNPAIIDPGYTGQVIVTFDPAKGDGGMVGATECYLYSCVEVDNSGKWEYQLAAWPSKSEKTKMTKNGNVWEITIPNLYTFYGVPSGKTITKILMLFTDGKSNGKSGRGTGGTDIVIVLGQESSGDIWAAVEGVQPISGQRPAGVTNGIYYGADSTSVTLCTYAASKTQPAKRVFLLGDMTDWKLKPEYQLKRDENYFWITLTGLEKGKEYRFQYAVERADGVKKQICDLYSEKVIHPNDAWEPRTADSTLIPYPLGVADGGYVTVIQPGKPAFQWSDATLHFQRPDRNNLVIYELWVYDYTPKRTIVGVQERLDYLQQLGVNAIELMPICEFDGNLSWGYNPVLYFAPDRAYGSENDIKTFIDECHKRGIAVIMDMVFNHTNGNNPMAKLYPWTSSSESETELRFNPWFLLGSEVKHSDNDYGEDWNHDFEPAHEMFKRSIQYWVSEYKVDGYRFDLSHGMCGGTKYNAVDNLKDYYNNGLKQVLPDGYMILEHWGNNADNDRPQLINEGMLCWVNTNYAYTQVASGWLDQKDDISPANKDGYVTYAESHDEERMQYKAKTFGNGAIKTNEATRLARVPACVIMNVLLNGSHMIWQFEEIGYDFSINCNAENPNKTSGGRVDPKPRPEPRGYFSDPNRVAAYQKCAQAIQLRTRLHPEWFAGNPSNAVLGHAQKIRYVQWENVIAVANFDAAAAQSYSLPSGTWYNYFDGGTASGTVGLQAGEVKIFTKTQVTLPQINLDLESLLPIENVSQDGKVAAQKILRDGQVMILVGEKVYNLQGQRVR